MVERLSDISSKIGKKCIFCVFMLFLSLCWTASRPYRLSYINAFASINTTNPKTNPWNFCKKVSRIGSFENLSFFNSAILKIFLIFFDFFFASFPWKSVKVSWLARMGWNFDQAKRDNIFWPRPNIMHPSVCTLKKFGYFEMTTQIWNNLPLFL